jgi:hypothetical protein
VTCSYTGNQEAATTLHSAAAAFDIELSTTFDDRAAAARRLAERHSASSDGMS